MEIPDDISMVKLDPRIFFYKLTVDSGGAPCVYNGILSLAICKPRIRSSAMEGDWIFGFGKNDPPYSNRLIYIAKVSKRLTDGTYYSLKKYSLRPDCIYKIKDGKFVLRDNARYHEDEQSIQRDVGLDPSKGRANVLLSEDFRYFGSSDTGSVRIDPTITKTIHALRTGHRVNHVMELYMALEKLRRDVWEAYPQAKVLGQPTEPTSKKSCAGAAAVVCIQGSKIIC